MAKTEDLRKSLDAQIERFLAENPFDSENNYNEYLAKLCQELSNVWKIYLCDSHGNQLTPNIAYSKKVYPKKLTFRKTEQVLYKNKNWIWRGYFHDALKSVASGQKSNISSIYHDFSTKDRVRTYSYPISNDIFLFVDIESPFT